jgi:uncharacterized Zn-binding protein involved in type VI secretion
MSLPWIVKGDKTSHGGTVLDGDPWTDIQGKSVATVGHLVACPKCKGTFPIVTGAHDTIVGGQPVARHGDHTACGALLISSQFLTHWSQGDGGIAAPRTGGSAVNPDIEIPVYDEQVQLVANAFLHGLPYFIEVNNGKTFSGYMQEDCKLPRIETLGPADYAIYWGDDALARIRS